MTVRVPEASEEQGFTLDPEGEAALLESIREADAGKLIDGGKVLRELRSSESQIARRSCDEL